MKFIVAFLAIVFSVNVTAQAVQNPSFFVTLPTSPNIGEDVTLRFTPGYDQRIVASRLEINGQVFSLYLYQICLSGDGSSTPPTNVSLGALSAGNYQANLYIFCEGMPDPIGAGYPFYRTFTVSPAGGVIFRPLPATNIGGLICLILIIGGAGIVVIRLRR
jgi:hypothetical protein